MGKYVFASSNRLQIIEFDENLDIECIDSETFQYSSPVMIIMISPKMSNKIIEIIKKKF